MMILEIYANETRVTHMKRDLQKRRMHVKRNLYPPQNGEIALWPNTRVVKCKCMFHKRETSAILIRATSTIF